MTACRSATSATDSREWSASMSATTSSTGRSAGRGPVGRGRPGRARPPRPTASRMPRGRGRRAPRTRAAGSTLGRRDRPVGPRGGRPPGERGEPAGPEAQPHDAAPATHLDVEPAGAHPGDGEGLARRQPGARVAAELDGERAGGVRQHLAVEPAPSGRSQRSDQRFSTQRSAARRPPARAPGRRAGRTRRAAAAPRSRPWPQAVAFVLSRHRPSLGRMADTTPTRGTTMAIAELKMLTLDSSDARARRDLLVGRARLGGRARPGRVRDAHRPGRHGPRFRHPRRPRGAGVAERARQQAVPPRPGGRRPRRRGRRACVELGATLPDEQPGETWRVLLDPSGHPFCLTQAANWG